MRRVAIVTAASKGMGLACARQLKSEGYDLAIMARGVEILHVGKELGAACLQGSTENNEDIGKLIELAMSEYGKIDVVVNNTGHSAKGKLLELTDKQWHQGVNLLLMNTIRMSRLVAPIMERNGTGSMINISTFGAKEPSLSFPISSVVRTALTSFTKLFVQQYGPSGLRMNNVLPGFIDSYPASDELISQIPARRQGTTSEVADVVSFLASDKSSYVNGQNILVDGGLTKSI